MAFLFGGGKPSSASPPDPVRDYQDELHKGCRTLEREDYKASLQEKEIRACIMKHARVQRFDICRIKAKEMIRLRQHRKRLVSTRGHMTSLIQQLSTVKSTKTLQGVMAKTTNLLKTLNTKTMDPVSVHRMLHDYERQSNLLQDSSEVLEGTLDDIFEGDTESEEMDDTMAGIFSELGLDARAILPSASSNVVAPPSYVVDDSSFEARLANLRARV